MHSWFRLVLETLEPLPKDRKCFRMVNGVLVERTIQDVIPALKTNADGLKQVLDELVKQYKAKQTEMDEWKVSRRLYITVSWEERDMVWSFERHNILQQQERTSPIPPINLECHFITRPETPYADNPNPAEEKQRPSGTTMRAHCSTMSRFWYLQNTKRRRVEALAELGLPFPILSICERCRLDRHLRLESFPTCASSILHTFGDKST